MAQATPQDVVDFVKAKFHKRGKCMQEIKDQASKKIDKEKVFFVGSFQELTNLHREIDARTTNYDDSSEVGAFCLKHSLNNFEFSNRPVCSGSIFTVKPSQGAPRSERVEFGSILVHEITHSKGGSEVEAYIAQRNYLRRFGLSGPSDYQILKIIFTGYHALAKLHAYKHFFGSFPTSRGGIMKGLVHSVRKLRISYLTPEYDFKKDWFKTIGSNG